MNSSLFLDYVRVLDLTDEKGMLCGRILADLGAEVIKVEKPGGDTARNIGPFYHNVPHPEKSLFWFAFNANKKGITLNIETRAGKDILKRLVEDADIVIESFSPGYLDELGLGYPSLEKINPGLIMVSITPFGQTGPYAQYTGSDIVITAMSGFLYVCGDEDRLPVRISFPQAYLHAAGQAAVGTLIAYHHRQRANEGQHIDVSAQESVLLCPMGLHQYLEIGGVVPRRAGPRQQLSPRIYRQMYWRCKDGYVCFGVYGGLFGLSFNQAMTKWLDEEGIECSFMKKRDWRSFDMATVTPEEIDQMREPLEKLFQRYTKSELYYQARKRRIIFAPVSTPKDLLEDEQLKARDFWQVVEHPELQAKLIYPGTFAKSSDLSFGIRHRAPLIGEHNEEIYIKKLNLKKDELCILKTEGVI